MSKGQIWTTIILGFILLLALIIGGFGYASLKALDDINMIEQTSNEVPVW